MSKLYLVSKSVWPTQGLTLCAGIWAGLEAGDVNKVLDETQILTRTRPRCLC